MNISSEIFTADGSNFSDYVFDNDTVLEPSFEMSSVLVFINVILFDIPMNSYVIWLIVTGTGNGLASEFFNLNLAVCEMVICVELILQQFIYEVEILRIAVYILDGMAMTGRPLFQCLICVERYLAVIHPVTFLKYKPPRYRVMSCLIAWVASFISGGIISIPFKPYFMYFGLLFVQLFLFLIIQLFCLVTVLRALKQSGPGQRGREREEENHIKRRAFYIILITTVAMFSVYAPYIIVVALYSSSTDPDGSTTVPDLLLSIGLVCFTSAGLVQPLLFLYRTGKPSFIKCK